MDLGTIPNNVIKYVCNRIYLTSVMGICGNKELNSVIIESVIIDSGSCNLTSYKLYFILILIFSDFPDCFCKDDSLKGSSIFQMLVTINKIVQV